MKHLLLICFVGTALCCQAQRNTRLARPPAGLDKTHPLTPAFGRFMSDYTRSHPFNGTILVQQNGKKIYNRSFGYANFQFDVPNTNDTKYKIASITKLFTAVLVMQLVEQGKVDLQQPIRTYLPGYKGAAGAKVSLFHLLTATSGIESNERDVQGDEIPAMYAKPYTTDELLDLFCSGKLETEPGKVWNYNNADYVILGKIIEAVCGRSYEAVLQERILNPLQMTHTGMFGTTKLIRNLATVYEVNDSARTIEVTPPIYTENYYAAGGLYATADDLLRFANALYDGKLVNAQSLEAIMQPYLENYGLGIWVYDLKVKDGKLRMAERQGAIWGTRTRLLHIFDKNLTIILLSNVQTTDIDALQAKMIGQLLQ